MVDGRAAHQHRLRLSCLVGWIIASDNIINGEAVLLRTWYGIGERGEARVFVWPVVLGARQECSKLCLVGWFASARQRAVPLGSTGIETGLEAVLSVVAGATSGLLRAVCPGTTTHH